MNQKPIDKMTTDELRQEMADLDQVRRDAEARQRECQEWLWKLEEEEQLSKKHGRKVTVTYEDEDQG